MQYHADALPLYELISVRLKALELSRGELFRRMGYSNMAKTGRRFQALLKGDFSHPASQLMLQRLPQALNVGDAFYDAIIEECLRRQRERLEREERIAAARYHREEAEARKRFVPHGMLVGTYQQPSPITAFALTGGAQRWLKVALDTSQPAITFVQQMKQYIQQHPEVPFFGPVTGFVVRYTYDHSVRFDKAGNPGARPQEFVTGNAKVKTSQHTLTEKQLARLIE